MTDDASTADLQAQLIREAEAAATEWEGTASRSLVPARKPSTTPSQVYSVRIPVHQLERLRAMAEERGVQPTALMREWVMERIAAEDAAVAPPAERLVTLVAELQRLAESVRGLAGQGASDTAMAPAAGPRPRRQVRLGATRRLTSPPSALDADHEAADEDTFKQPARQVRGRA